MVEDPLRVVQDNEGSQIDLVPVLLLLGENPGFQKTQELGFERDKDARDCELVQLGVHDWRDGDCLYYRVASTGADVVLHGGNSEHVCAADEPETFEHTCRRPKH